MQKEIYKFFVHSVFHMYSSSRFQVFFHLMIQNISLKAQSSLRDRGFATLFNIQFFSPLTDVSFI